MGLTDDIRPRGIIRAFEPRREGWDDSGPWKCRGRVAKLHRETDGRMRNTRQCNTRLQEGQRFCGRCGGLIAWGGSVEYNGVTLKHLERMELDGSQIR